MKSGRELFKLFVIVALSTSFLYTASASGEYSEDLFTEEQWEANTIVLDDISLKEDGGLELAQREVFKDELFEHAYTHEMESLDLRNIEYHEGSYLVGEEYVEGDGQAVFEYDEDLEKKDEEPLFTTERVRGIHEYRNNFYVADDTSQIFYKLDKDWNVEEEIDFPDEVNHALDIVFANGYWWIMDFEEVVKLDEDFEFVEYVEVDYIGDDNIWGVEFVNNRFLVAFEDYGYAKYDENFEEAIEDPSYKYEDGPGSIYGPITYNPDDRNFYSVRAHDQQVYELLGLEEGEGFASEGSAETDTFELRKSRPSITNLNYSLPESTGINVTIFGSPGTEEEEKVKQKLEGVKTYGFEWENIHEEFQVSFELSTEDHEKSPEITNFTLESNAYQSRYADTFSSDGKPRSFFGENDEVVVRTEGDFADAPELTVVNSEGERVVEAMEMSDQGDYYEQTFEIDGSTGWHDVIINNDIWKNSIYSSNAWQESYKDEDGNKYAFRRNITLEDTDSGTSRYFDFVDNHMEFSYEPDISSVKVLAWNGTHHIEIPSQIYNASIEDRKIERGNLVFPVSIGDGEERDYIVVSSKDEMENDYETDLELYEYGEKIYVENQFYRVELNQDEGGMISDINNKLGNRLKTGTENSAEQSMRFDKGINTFSAIEENNPDIDIKEGELKTKVLSEGNLSEASGYPYSYECSFYSWRKDFLCQKEVGFEVSDVVENLVLNGFLFDPEVYEELIVRESGEQTSVFGDDLEGSQGGFDFYSEWTAFKDEETREGFAEIFYSEQLADDQDRELEVYRGENELYFKRMLFSDDSQSVSEGDTFETMAAMTVFNSNRDLEYLDEKTKELVNPLEIDLSEEETIDEEYPELLEKKYNATDDTTDLNVSSKWSDDTFLDELILEVVGSGKYEEDTILFNKTYPVRSNGSYLSESWVNVSVPGEKLNAGEVELNLIMKDVAGKKEDVSFTTTLDDNTPPEVVNLTHEPSEQINLDPDVDVEITADIEEYTGIDEPVNLYWGKEEYSGSKEDLNKIEMDKSSSEANVYRYTSVFTPTEENNYTYFVEAEDDEENQGTSEKVEIEVSWDHVWELYTNLTDPTVSYEEEAHAGNMTINNTGDFKKTFDLGLEESPPLLEERMALVKKGSNGVEDGYYIEDAELVVEPGEQKERHFYVAGRDADYGEGVDNFEINIKNDTADPEKKNTSILVTTSTGGPFLDISVSGYSSVIQQGETSNINIEVVNRGNETEEMVETGLILPDGLNADEEEVNVTVPDLDAGESMMIESEFSADSSASGMKTLEVFSSGLQDNRFHEFEVEVLELDDDVVDDTDTDPSGIGEPEDYITEEVVDTEPRYFHETESFSSLIGISDTHSYSFENPVNQTLVNGSLTLSQHFAQYVEAEPVEFDELGVNETLTIDFEVDPPGYLSPGNYPLQVTFEGKGVFGDSEDSSFNFTKNMDLDIVLHEISEEEAGYYVDEIRSIHENLSDEDIESESIESIRDEVQELYDDEDYGEVQEKYQEAQEIKEKAIRSNYLLEELEERIDHFNSRGITTERTERILDISEMSLEREDFDTALERLQEAEEVLEIETAGEVNYLYLIEENRGMFFLLLLVVAVLTVIVFGVTRRAIIDHRISKLENEQRSLINMRTELDKKTFEDFDLSIREYEDSVEDYQNQLVDNMEELVDLRSKKTHMFSINSLKTLKDEKEKFEELIQDLQKDYVVGDLQSSRVYNLKMRKYNKKLSEIESKIAEKEARTQLNKKSLAVKVLNLIPFFG